MKTKNKTKEVRMTTLSLDEELVELIEKEIKDTSQTKTGFIEEVLWRHFFKKS